MLQIYSAVFLQSVDAYTQKCDLDGFLNHQYSMHIIYLILQSKHSAHSSGLQI